MRVIITIDAPEGATFKVTEATVEKASPGEQDTGQTNGVPSDVERYWRRYLSDNGRELYGAAAAIEREGGIGYTLEVIAERLSREYASAQSIHRTSGRSARKWKASVGSKAPIQLVPVDYKHDDSVGGMRTKYRLPEGVADEIAEL